MNKEIYGEDYPRISRIECLHLHNFKSFKDNHVIGPFLNLTAIVGPNGSGKSNVLDAVCFILAIRTTHMREGNLKQFVYRLPGEEVGEATAGKAWVIMDFALPDGRIIKFKRVLNSKGATHYYIDEGQLSHEEYIKELQKHKFLAQVRSYFLVMQGEIDIILQNCSKELTKVIEEVSGSKEYKAQYEELKVKLEQSQQQITSISKNIQELRGEKRKAKGVKANVEAFEKAREKVAQLQTELYATMCGFYEKRVKELEQHVEELQEDIQKQAEEKEALITRQKELQEELKELTTEETSKERSKEQLKEDRMINTKNLQKIEAKLTIGKKELSTKEAAKTVLEKKIAEQNQKKKDLEEKKGVLEEEYEVLVETIEKGDGKKGGEKYREEYYRIKHEIETKTFDIKSEVQKLSAHGGIFKKKLSVYEEQLHGLRNQLESLTARLEGLDPESFNHEIEEKNAELKELHEKYANLCEKHKELNKDMMELEMLQASREYELKKIEHEHEYKTQRGKEYHLIEQLKTKVRGCRGLLIQLVNACEKKFEVAVKVGLGKYLTHLVVDDESAAASCNISLKDAGIMKDILILSNVPRKAATNQASALNSISSLGAMQLVDVIEYNGNIKKLKEAIMYIAGRKIVCDTLQTAKTIRSQGFKDIITQSGDVLKQGVLTGGHNEMLLALEFQQRDYAQKHKDALEKLAKVKNDIEELKSMQNEKELIEVKESVDSLGFTLGNLERQKKAAEREQESLTQEIERVSKAISTLEKEKEKISKLSAETEAEISEYKQTITKLENEAFQDLCAKLKIESIAEYEGTDLVTANENHAKKAKLFEEIEQIRAQIELVKANKMQNKLEKLNENLEQIVESMHELEKNKTEEEEKANNIENEYEMVCKSIEEIAGKRETLHEKQKSNENQIQSAIAVIDDTKKELLTSVCQIKNNARLKIRTVDELKLKNIQVSIEPITKKEKMLIKGMDIDYRVDYEKYDIDMSIITSKDLEEKEKGLLENITSEEKKIADFNALALMKGDETEDLEEIDKEIEKERKALEAVSKEHENQEKTFRQVKEYRRQSFKTCYEQLSTYIDNIYQELTKTEDTGFMYGGHAILVPENVGEPYNGEIQYAPTPPGKRVVYELEQLSGGEKALAALALVLAIQKYQKSPVLILDEVDAHLDIKNVKKVAEFLKKTVEESGFQCIVISHKETLAEVFHSLLGVAHSKKKQTSVVYSLDLRPYS